MISIVIPLYNKENFILETVQSVLDQTYKDFELIIVNDGSTDSSSEVINSVSDSRLKVINIQNGGVCVARNVGIQTAKFDYIAFLDADDWWDKDFLTELVNAIKKYPAEKVFASGRSRVFMNVVERYQNQFLPIQEGTGIIDYITVISKFLPPVNSSNVIISKQEIINAGLFKEGQKKHEDHDLWLRICSENKVVFVNKNLSFYRKNVVNSGSQGVYTAPDFMRYLQTIKSVKETLNTDRLVFFKKYYNRFILLTFIKFESKYSKDELNGVYEMVINICDSYYAIIIKIVKLIPFGISYSLLKKIK